MYLPARLLHYFRNTTFRRQLAVIASVGVLCVSLLSALATSWQGSRQLYSGKLQDGLRITHNLALQSRLALAFGSSENVGEALAAASAFPDVVRIEIRHADGRVLLERGAPLIGGGPANSSPLNQDPYLEKENAEGWRFVAPVWSRSTGESPFEVEERKDVLLGQVVVEQSKATLAALVREVFIVNFAAGLAFAVLFVLALRILARHLTRPLALLSETMARAELGEMGLRAELAGPRDIADMAHAFNSMMEALEQRETELRTARDAALRFAKLKADFAATVSHEIRTPLNGVIGTLEMLRLGDMDADQQELLSLAWDSSHYLLELINNILDFSRLEAGRMEVEATDFALVPLVDGIIKMFHAQAKLKNIVISSAVADELPAYLNGDPARIRQVLINLIGNALKFTERGSVSLVVSLDNTRQQLRFSVKDTGIGIAPEQQSLIFDSFTQADTSTTRRYGGSGLGLAICKQIVKLMGGEIGVESAPETGSHFWFFLPCTPGKAGARPLPGLEEHQWPASRHGKILIVEDNKTNQVVASGMLRLLGCTTGLANNGLEAIAQWHDGHWDLILMDCSMPGMDGYEATITIRGLESGTSRRTPIIAMTANTLPEDIERCKAAGMDDHLPKPLSLESLSEKLELWLRTTRLSQSEMVQAITPTEAPAIPPTPLDGNVLKRLRDALGTSLGEALRPFIEDMPGYLVEIEQAIEHQDALTLRRVAHVIKGAASNLGANVIALLARDLEEQAERGELPAGTALLLRLRTEFALIEPTLVAELDHSEDCSPSVQADAALVLVVDDDRSTRAALKHALVRSGFRVAEAQDGSQALDWLEQNEADAILMDALMPAMDGFTACAALKRHPQWKDIPVLMITALEDRHSIERAFEAGASDFIPKPIHLSVVNQRVRRIIEATRTQRHAHNLAYSDALTGLPNRLKFNEYLTQGLQQAGKNGNALAVLFLDLDRFKFINDTMGHEAGDELLRLIALRLKGCVRTDDCVSRLGGDEFTVLLDDLPTPAIAASVAQNICRTVSAPLVLKDQEMVVTASVGISVYPNDGQDISSLLRHAETAMYRAKQSGSGFCYYEPEMESAVSDRLKIENDLRRAIERKEITVFYQPVIAADSGNMVGVEALVRWLHPEQGLVSPAAFIPIAEETGLILPIGEHVLRTACQQIRNWLDMGAGPLHVAVNLSVKQLEQPDLVQIVRNILDDTRLPADALVLEITESVLVNRERDTLKVLDDLRALGISLSIDDFGTGYSSLSYLKHLPADNLKIDRSFIQDIPKDQDAVAIVTGIMALAHSLRLTVIAEGVETAEQQATLTGLKCDCLQGFYFSKPLPAEVIETRLLGSTSLHH